MTGRLGSLAGGDGVLDGVRVEPELLGQGAQAGVVGLAEVDPESESSRPSSSDTSSSGKPSSTTLPCSHRQEVMRPVPSLLTGPVSQVPRGAGTVRR